MHQKKSEVQIGKDSSGVSSDFNPIPSIVFPHPPPPLAIYQKQHQNSSNFHLSPHTLSVSVSSSPAGPFSSASSSDANPQIHIIGPSDSQNDPIAHTPAATPKTTAHKRPLLAQPTTPSSPSSNSLSKSPTLSHSLHQYTVSSTPPLKSSTLSLKKQCLYRLRIPSRSSTKAAAFHILRRFRHLRRLRVHLRLVILLSLPFFYFLLSHPSRSFILDFISAFAFSAALLFSLNLALPRLPSIRLFLARSFPIKLSSATQVPRPPLPVFWSIGSRPKMEKRGNSGCWVQAYRNGDVYEGEFHKGKCSGSGVYYYYMSGRYEGDWVDGKYDGYGVETWARGSRYRGQYRQGLRHGFGVYRFYTGDVYAGEWSNGQSHGCGVHTCEDGSRYVGEFKWGVKHGLGHYHFR